MRTSLLFVGAALLAAVATITTSASAQPSLADAAHATQATVTVRSSAYGRILFDGRGRALYAFTHDTRGHSTCTGACAKAWPPYVISVRARAATGVKASLLGVVRRPDGTRQATCGGRPLYYYIGDTKPGQVLCQNVTEFGGVWLVMRPSGQLVR